MISTDEQSIFLILWKERKEKNFLTACIFLLTEMGAAHNLQATLNHLLLKMLNYLEWFVDCEVGN